MTERSELLQIVIDIYPNPRGRSHNRGIPWIAEIDGTELCESTTPCFAACRELIELEVNPETTVLFRHKGRKSFIFRPMTVGRGADLMVTEGKNSSPRFARYVPYPHTDE